MVEPEPVSSRVVYSIARRTWGPTLRQFGFRNSPETSFASWTKPYQGGNLFISWQVDKYGWSEEWGSEFTVEMERGGKRVHEAGMDESARWTTYMTTSDLAAVEVIYDEIQSRLPEVPPGNDLRPFVPGQDVWLPYYTPEDVERWAGFLLPHVPTLLNGHAPGSAG